MNREQLSRDQLKRIMKKHSWTMDDIAKIAGASIHSVRAWLRPDTSHASRTMRADTARTIRLASDALAKPTRRKSGGDSQEQAAA